MVILVLPFVTFDTMWWWLTVQSSETKPVWDCYMLPSEGSKARTPLLWSMICINGVELREYWRPWMPNSLPSKQLELQHAEYLMEAQKEWGDLYVRHMKKSLCVPTALKHLFRLRTAPVWMGKWSQAGVSAHIPWPGWVLVGDTAGVKHSVCPPLPTSPTVLEHHLQCYSGYTWQRCRG